MTESPRNKDTDAPVGASAYSTLFLLVYDHFVLRFSLPRLWGCPRPEIVDLYRSNAGTRHLDIGVGTGYFLQKAGFDAEKSEVHLMDLNPAPLAKARRRLAGLNVTTRVGSALEDFGYPENSFDSVGMSLLLHCVPGKGFAEKGEVFDRAARVLRPGGRVFGATVLAHGVPVSPRAQRVMSAYRDKGIFSNAEDSLDGLETELKARLDDCRVWTHGCVALFEGVARGA